MSRTGVLLLGFGGPDSLESVRPFMCNLMDREPSDELVERVCRRYLTIGGSSPLLEIAGSMASGLQSRLANAGHDVPVRVGMRYWHPFIGEALSELCEAGCDRVVTVSLSPFESKVASGAYREAIAEALGGSGSIEVVEAPLVSTLDAYGDYFAGAVATALTDTEPNQGAIIAFTAHSLPKSDLVEDDPYVTGLQRAADGIAVRLGLPAGSPAAGVPMLQGVPAYGSSIRPRAWFLVFQSAGQKPGEWLGPDLDTFIDAAAASGVPAIVACPIGFMTDHLETLYDLDVVAADRALSAGMDFFRVPAPNDYPAVLDGMADAIAAMI